MHCYPLRTDILRRSYKIKEPLEDGDHDGEELIRTKKWNLRVHFKEAER